MQGERDKTRLGLETNYIKGNDNSHDKEVRARVAFEYLLEMPMN